MSALLTIYHSGNRPRNGNQVHLKLIIILGGINWSYKKQEIVEIALLLSRQNTDARFGFKWKRECAGWGLSKQSLRGLGAIKSGEMEKNITEKVAVRGLFRVAGSEFYTDFIFRALRLALLGKTQRERCLLEGSQPCTARLSYWRNQRAERTLPCLLGRCGFASSVSSTAWVVRASFGETWPKLQPPVAVLCKNYVQTKGKSPQSKRLFQKNVPI